MANNKRRENFSKAQERAALAFNSTLRAILWGEQRYVSHVINFTRPPLSFRFFVRARGEPGNEASNFVRIRWSVQPYCCLVYFCTWPTVRVLKVQQLRSRSKSDDNYNYLIVQAISWSTRSRFVHRLAITTYK